MFKATRANLTEYFKNQFSLDLRALALMRICFGFILLIDIFIRLGSLEAHYTQDGVMPLYFLLKECWNRYYFSLFTFSDNIFFVALMFFAQSLFAFFLMIGYRTKLSTFMSWIFLISLHNRNPFILQGGDDLLRLTIFWGIFLPWHKRFSLDSLLSKNKISDNRYFDIPTLGFALLVSSVYIVSALLKNKNEWYHEGTALYYALSIDQMVLPFGKKIYYYPEFLRSVTIITWLWELFGPALLFIPIKNSWFRNSFVLSIILFHLAIFSTLFVGLFFTFGISTAIGLLSVSFMDKVERKFRNSIEKIKSLGMKISSALHSSESSLIQRLISKIDSFYILLVRNCFLAFIIFFSFFWNMGSVRGTGFGIAPEMKWFGYMFRFDQNWGMFAPTVLKDDGWFILNGKTVDNKEIDINRAGLTTDYSKPISALKYIKDDRWRKFGENISFTTNRIVRPYYCKYLIRKWNKEHPENTLVSLQVIYMKETTKLNYKYSYPKKEILCNCK